MAVYGNITANSNISYDFKIDILDKSIEENLKCIDAFSVLTEEFDIVLEGDKFDIFKEKIVNAITKLIQKIKEILKWIGEKLSGFFNKVKSKFNKNLKEELAKAKKKVLEKSNESALVTESVTQDELDEWLASSSGVLYYGLNIFEDFKRMPKYSIKNYYTIYSITGCNTKSQFEAHLNTYIEIYPSDPDSFNYDPKKTKELTFAEFINEDKPELPGLINKIITKVQECLQVNAKYLETLNSKVKTISNVGSLKDLLSIGKKDEEEKNNTIGPINEGTEGLNLILKYTNKCATQYYSAKAKAEAFLARVNG